MINPIQNMLFNNLELFLRILAAALCGGIIGYERSKRQKEAGLRTHIIVALGSALIMIVSKYGCIDMVQKYGINVDSSRIASNIITGVSFLGAGVIFVRGASIKGLTTAAGIWTTAGVGIAIGTGMYAVGIFSTAMIVLIQIMLHKWIPFSSSETLTTSDITVTISNNSESLNKFLSTLEKYNITINDFSITKKPSDSALTLRMSVRMLREASITEIFKIFEEIPEIISFKINY